MNICMVFWLSCWWSSSQTFHHFSRTSKTWKAKKKFKDFSQFQGPVGTLYYLFFQMFRQNTLKHFFYFERYLMIFEFWGFVLVITQCSKMLIGLYLDKYFIFHNDFQVSNIDTKFANSHNQRCFEGGLFFAFDLKCWNIFATWGPFVLHYI